MKYKILSSMVMALLAGGPLYAAIDPALGGSQQTAAAQSPTGDEQREIEPAMLVEQGMNKMLAFLNQEQRPDEQTLMDFLEQGNRALFRFSVYG